MDEKNEKRWYIIQTYSGQELGVKEDLESRIKSQHMEDYIFTVLVPQRKIAVKDKKGNDKEKIVEVYPGYVYVEMIMQQEAWYVVRNTPHVTGLLGSSGKGTLPVPVHKAEMDGILREAGVISDPTYDHLVGKKIKVVDGPFIDREAIVKAVNNIQKTAVISVHMFGRLNDTTISIDDIAELA
ncbi:MAG: transcription termination/antitermination protein NusG [Acholeplasmatales bacterium]|jgi:transcriptional antiterminator NusG|nr:transcription termination/antitermination protein NusG [Acholeplasmatales bacterium]